ncbi:MAG: YqgE/AlgH family protein [Planctomycetota bacterium]
MHDPNLSQTNDSLVGRLLVASTMMGDPLLSRSVSLIVHHDDQHVFAVLLNRPMAAPPTMTKMLAGETAEKSPSPTNRLSPNAEGSSSTELTVSPNLPPVVKTVSDAAKSLGAIHFGGPLSGPVVAVHGASEYAEAEAGRGVYVAARKELLETLVREKSTPFRLIVGHLGWTQEQLAQERDAGYWHLIDATRDQVFEEDAELWPSVIRRATSSSLARWIGCPDTPSAGLVN